MSITVCSPYRAVPSHCSSREPEESAARRATREIGVMLYVHYTLDWRIVVLFCSSSRSFIARLVFPHARLAHYTASPRLQMPLSSFAGLLKALRTQKILHNIRRSGYAHERLSSHSPNGAFLLALGALRRSIFLLAPPKYRRAQITLNYGLAYND